MITFSGIAINADFANQAESLFTKKQRYVDQEVVRLMEPYTPKRTGTKIDIGASATLFGTGVIRYHSSIARRNYYMNKGTGKGGMNAKSNRGMRGKMWFERMKADHRSEILKGAQKIK